MASLTVRNIDDGDLAHFAAYARANNRSVAAEVREFIAERPKHHRNKREVIAELRSFRAQMKARHGILSDSSEIIRQMRDEE